MKGMMDESVEKRRIYGVSELNALIKGCLEQRFGQVWLEGEVSNLRQPGSGHMYFTLKDRDAQIRAVLFRGSQAGLRVQVRDGLKVRAFGQVTVYERSGDYQLIVRLLEDAGAGALQEQFEKLKQKLAAEGLFDQSRKKKLPLLPRHVAVVTSATGAAVRDILNVITRRFPDMHILIVPVHVQGPRAASEIEKAIRWLNGRGGIDVMIVGRGGGSLEDLWCFNEENVARAIADSQIPVISGVGHEIDFTISDFVADLRAPTPSAAAELLVGRREEFDDKLKELDEKLRQALSRRLLELRTRYMRLRHSYAFREPTNLLRGYMQRVDQLEMRAAGALVRAAQAQRNRLNELRARPAFHLPAARVQQGRSRLEQLQLRLPGTLVARCEARRNEFVRAQTALVHAAGSARDAWRVRVRQAGAQLRAMNPYAVLERGYSISYTQDGEIVRHAARVKRGERLVTRLADGTIESQVERTEQNKAAGEEKS
jgi:exodeoxyribonuclease VII large subunit